MRHNKIANNQICVVSFKIFKRFCRVIKSKNITKKEEAAINAAPSPDTVSLSVVAAATKNHDNGKNYDPGAVIVKDVAQAVVIHYVSLRELL